MKYKILDLDYINFNFEMTSNNSKSYNKKLFYWICQFTGWGILLAVNLIVTSSMEGLNTTKTIFISSLSVVGFLLTHTYRNILIKYDLLNRSLKFTGPLILLVSLLLSTIMVSIYVPINLNYKIFADPYKWDFVTFIASILNVAVVFLVWNLIYFFIYFFENYKRAEIESLIWEAAVKDYELKTLKTQLNPHFMFNAMNGIRALIEENPSKAQVALTKLSNILRYSLRIERTETVPLIDEIKVVKDFLDLECIRYEERINFNLNYDQASENIEIPPMMLQTLVENGIKHGISNLPEGGIINIDANVESDKLKIKIVNSGYIDLEAIKNSTGFGINNTKHRLYLLYGEKAQLNIFNSNGFVNAEVIIPIGGTNK